MDRRSLHIALVAVTFIVSACGSSGPTARQTVGSSPQESTTSSIETGAATGSQNEPGTVEVKTDFECPVTIPPQPGFVATSPEDVTYSEHFPAPDPWPSEYPHDGMVWYGSEELWTVLAIDGDHGVRKSVWWSVNFPGGIDEEQPVVSVTWTRLDSKESVVVDNGDEATNAFTPEEGWFMIAGIDPDVPGCWEVEANYKGASLSYVYERT